MYIHYILVLCFIGIKHNIYITLKNSLIAAKKALAIIESKNAIKTAKNTSNTSTNTNILPEISPSKKTKAGGITSNLNKTTNSILKSPYNDMGKTV